MLTLQMWEEALIPELVSCFERAVAFLHESGQLAAWRRAIGRSPVSVFL